MSSKEQVQAALQPQTYDYTAVKEAGASHQMMFYDNLYHIIYNYLKLESRNLPTKYLFIQAASSTTQKNSPERKANRKKSAVVQSRKESFEIQSTASYNNAKSFVSRNPLELKSSRTAGTRQKDELTYSLHVPFTHEGFVQKEKEQKITKPHHTSKDFKKKMSLKLETTSEEMNFMTGKLRENPFQESSSDAEEVEYDEPENSERKINIGSKSSEAGGRGEPYESIDSTIERKSPKKKIAVNKTYMSRDDDQSVTISKDKSFASSQPKIPIVKKSMRLKPNLPASRQVTEEKKKRTSRNIEQASARTVETIPIEGSKRILKGRSGSYRYFSKEMKPKPVRKDTSENDFNADVEEESVVFNKIPNTHWQRLLQNVNIKSKTPEEKKKGETDIYVSKGEFLLESVPDDELPTPKKFFS